MSDPFTEESTGRDLDSGRIKTNSRVYKFWLSTFRGFTVERKVSTPLGYSLGRLKYKVSWVMRPKDTE